MSTKNLNRPSTVFPTVFEQGKGNPIVGQLANDSAVDENFTEIYKLNKELLGKLLAPIQFLSYSFSELTSSEDNLDDINIRYGVWQPFENGIITQNRISETSLIAGEFWQYFNNPQNKALTNMQGYPKSLPRQDGKHQILEFPGGNLILNSETNQVLRISGEVGRYFFKVGGYKMLGFPLDNEIWHKSDLMWIQEFEKGRIDYSHNGKETGFTFSYILK